jgi:hypothetical protein
MISSGIYTSSSRGWVTVCSTGVIIWAGVFVAPTAGKTIVAGRSNREGRSLLRWEWAGIDSKDGADVETLDFGSG